MTSIDGQLNWDRERGFVAPARPQSRERDPALATIAQLRAFSLLLCLDAKLANELVEITLLRVCVATDLSHLNPSHLGWLIGRLRTYFYADFSRRQAAIDPHLPLPGFGSQRHGDLLAAFASLTVEQREALILIEAAGLSYQAGARICRKPFLTFKKFVARARATTSLCPWPPMQQAISAWRSCCSGCRGGSPRSLTDSRLITSPNSSETERADGA